MSLTANIQNISIYKSQQQKILYMIAKHNNTFVKLYMKTEDTNDVYKMVNHDGMVQFEITVNRNLTCTYKNSTIPFYDVKKYELLTNENQSRPKNQETQDDEWV